MSYYFKFSFCRTDEKTISNPNSFKTGKKHRQTPKESRHDFGGTGEKGRTQPEFFELHRTGNQRSEAFVTGGDGRGVGNGINQIILAIILNKSKNKKQQTHNEVTMSKKWTLCILMLFAVY